MVLGQARVHFLSIWELEDKDVAHGLCNAFYSKNWHWVLHSLLYSALPFIVLSGWILND